MKTTVNPCDATRNRLLAEPSPHRVPAELRTHVDACSACKEFLIRYTELHADLKALPAPNSELKKIEFLEMLESAGPIIRSVPSSGSTTFIPWKLVWQNIAKPLAVTAACVAVGFGIWSAVPGKRGTQMVADAPRHELLDKIVKHNVALAKANDSKTKIETLTGLVADLQSETRNMLLAADAADADSLAVLFEKVINDGIVKQARDMNSFAVPDRHDMLKAAAARLAVTADDISAMEKSAPPPTKAALLRIQQAATKGSRTLTNLATGQGA